MEINSVLNERKKCVHTVLKFNLNKVNGNSYLSCQIRLGNFQRNIGTEFKANSEAEINTIKEKYFSILIKDFKICNSCRGFGEKGSYESFLSGDEKEGHTICKKCNGLGVHK